MKSVNVKWVEVNKYLNQVFTKGIQYAFLTRKFEQINHFAYCKDYLQDIVYCNIHKSKFNLYGMQYDYDKDLKLPYNTLLAIRSLKKNKILCKKNVDNLLSFLNDIETKLKFRKTRLILCNNIQQNYDCIILDGSAKWKFSPPLISLYSLLIRIGVDYNNQGPIEYLNLIKNTKSKFIFNRDQVLIDKIIPLLNSLFNNGIMSYFYKAKIENYPKSDNIYDVHNSSGIIALANKNCYIKYKK